MTKRIMTLDFERGDCSLFRKLCGKSLQKFRKGQLDLQVPEGEFNKKHPNSRGDWRECWGLYEQ